MRYLNMRIIVLLVFFCAICCCGQRRDISTAQNLKENGWDYKAAILKGFISFDARHFSHADSCLFVNYINNYFSLDKVLVPRLLGDWIMFNETCRYNYFSFTILKNQKTDSTLYYGQSDVYTIRQSNSIEREKLIEVKNEALNSIVNILLPKNLPEWDKLGRVKDIIGNLYYEDFENRAGIKAPCFTHSLSLGQLYRRYNNADNREIFESYFSKLKDSELMTLENPDHGILVFIPDFSSKTKVNIKEFIIISKDRLRINRTDSYPDDLMGCLKIR